MALDDFAEPEIAITAAVTAAIFSPRARKLIRKGLVYGTAGVLVAGDAVASLARGVGQGIQQAGAAATQAAQEAMQQGQEETRQAAGEVKEEETPVKTSLSRRKAALKTEAPKPAEEAGG
jgi:flavin-dependent dehydrogenase